MSGTGVAVGSPTVAEVGRLAHHEPIADPAAPSAVRRALRRWLARLPIPREYRDDLVLATSEAVANVVDHAYAGMAEIGGVTVEGVVEGRLAGDRRVVVSVADQGRWRPIPSHPGYRGRGLHLMRACTAELRIAATSPGTRVTMISHPF